MLSPDTQNLLSRILLALAEGERIVEEARKEISNEDSYDIQAIFKALDNNGDNYITPKDIQKYLNFHGLEVNLIEVKLLILFYDQDHDFALTYGEIFKIIHPGKEIPKIPKYKKDEELNVKVDEKLYNLLEKEISMSRIIIALLEEIKHKRDFNIHSAFHALKYYACITGDSINIFLKNCGMRPTAGDVRAIVKRLDINKDDIIDFCEFHAFLGFPDCTFCCPCFPCGNCGIKYCENCLQDIPCYLLGCDHKGMDSKMKCTSFEHNPRIGIMTSLYDSINKAYPSSRNKSKLISKRGDNEEDEKNDYYLKSKEMGKNSNTYRNRDYNQFYTPGTKNNQRERFFYNNRNGYYGNGTNLTPEQFKLLQNLTNPEQLHKFMTISGILDRQNAEEILLTDNLSLRLSPIRDFDPKEWGCKNCSCNIHSNPNVPCNCCSCNVCPFNSNKNASPTKQKQLKFPKNSLYSYSYSYEPDNSGPNNISLLNSYRTNNKINMNSPQRNRFFYNNETNINSPKRNRVIFDNESNKYIKPMQNSNDYDEEEEYINYMKKVNILKDNFESNKRKKNNINSPNKMIYSDEMSDNNYRNNNTNNNIDNEEQQSNKPDKDENEYENENIRQNKILLNKMHKKEENNINQNPIKNTEKRGQKNPNFDNYENENKNNFIQEQNPNQIWGNNNFNPYAINNANQKQHLNDKNSNYNPNINQAQISKISPNFESPKKENNSNNINQVNNPFIIPNNKNNDNNDSDNNFSENYDFFNDYTKKPLYKTIYVLPKKADTNNNNTKTFVSGLMEEESEDDLSSNNLYKSIEEIIDENEKIFIKYLKVLIKSEKEIEFSKRDLMRQPDFNGEDAFRLFEKEGTGVVTKDDLIFGLKLLGINPTNNQITIILNKYDLEENGFLNYDDFFDMVVSFNDEDRKKVEKRKSNRKIKNRKIELFSPLTRELYKKLFLVIIEEEERLEEFKQSLNIDDNMMNELFNKINVDKDGLCNKYEFANYCIRNKICKEKKDAYLGFIRLNRCRDGGLERKEFSIELKSSILGK